MANRENTIICFGDSITKGYVPFLEEEIEKDPQYVDFRIVNEGIGGETSQDGLKRINKITACNPKIVIVGFGMNDACGSKDVSIEEFEGNMLKIVKTLQERGAEVRLLTMHPIITYNPIEILNSPIDKFNKTIREISLQRHIKLININYFWKREFENITDGLRDKIHPNEKGNKLYAKIISKHLKRRSTIILWQYNGHPCACNYHCPYCLSDPRKQKGDHFWGTIEKWRKALKKTFGDQRLVLYLANGEPTIGKNFLDVLNMVGDEPAWSIRMTSNISQPLDKIVKTKVAKEGRLDINASFHPTMVNKEDFLKQILFLRKNGIEVPVVYVMWPPFFERFEEDFEFFNRHKFLVHMRRFQGFYRRRKYPQAYTEKERRFMARYMDDATIKYMLSFEPSFGKLTWSGMDFFILDSKGNVGYCDDLRPDRHCLGNVFRDFKPFTEPRPFPKHFVSDTTVDGVANFLELNYEQLDKRNNVMFFARQGGVYRTADGVFYKNMNINLDDPRVRTEYRFPPRNLRDCYYIFRYQDRDLGVKVRDVLFFLTPDSIKKGLDKVEYKIRRSIFLRSFLKKLLKIVRI